MKFSALLTFAFLFTLLLFTYGVEGGKNKDTRDRDRRRQDRREKRLREKKNQQAIDSNPTVLESDPTFPVITEAPIDTDDNAGFGEPTVMNTRKRPHRHNHKQRGKDKGEKAKKHKKDTERRREQGTGQVVEPEIVSFDDMLSIGVDPTEPAPAPAPTSKHGIIAESIPSTVEHPITDEAQDEEDTAGEIQPLPRTEQITDEATPTPTPTPTPQVETQTSRRPKGGKREGGKKDKDKKNKNKRRNEKEQRRNEADRDIEDVEITPTEFEFSPTMQSESPTTTFESRRRGDGTRRDKEDRKKDKKKHRSTMAPAEVEVERTQAVNEVIPSPEPEAQTETRAPKERNHPKKDKNSKRDRNREKQTLTSDPAEEQSERRKTVTDESRGRENNGDRREREKNGRNAKTDSGRGGRRKDQETLREPQDVTNRSTIDECRSDRDCSQGSCCEMNGDGKICREYSHQEGQKCKDMCSCHTGLICQAPEPTRRSQRNKKLGPSRCRVPGVNGMGGDFVGIVQDALDDVLNTMKKSDRSE